MKTGFLPITILFTNYKSYAVFNHSDLLVRVVVYLTRHLAQFDHCV